MITDIRALADSELHLRHNEVLAQLRIARTAKEHFDDRVTALDADEKAIRAEFDRRFYAEFPEELPDAIARSHAECEGVA